MKKILGRCLIGLSLAGAASVWAQSVPPGLIDNLKIVGIQKWEVVHTNYSFVKAYPHGGNDVTTYYEKQLPAGVALTDDSPVYIINMTVVVGNSGDAKVLLKDPQFMVTVMRQKEGAEVLGNLGANEAANGKISSEAAVYKGTAAPLEEIPTELGMARLVADRTRPASWRPIAEIPCAEDGAKKDKQSQQQFEIVVKGRDDVERAKQIFESFNIMNNQNRKWALRLEGTATVGWHNKGKSETTAMVFAHDPVDIILESKPTLPDQIAFPN